MTRFLTSPYNVARLELVLRIRGSQSQDYRDAEPLSLDRKARDAKILPERERERKKRTPGPGRRPGDGYLFAAFFFFF